MNAPIRSSDKSAQRQDCLETIRQTGNELDRWALEEIVKRTRLGSAVSALECECGFGEQALRMAQAGAEVLAVGRQDVGTGLTDAARALGVDSRLRFMQMAGHSDVDAFPGAPFDVAFCRGGIPSLPYRDAVRFVRRLLLMTKIGGKLYFSAYGLYSDLGDHYPHSEKTVKERYAELEPDTARKYGIEGPVCLYTERDLFILLFEAGASVLRTFTTTHGTVKAVAVRV